MTIATGILVCVAATVFGTLAVAFLYAVLARGRNWWREFLSPRVYPFLFVGLAVAATTLGIGFAAKRTADDALRLSVADIEADCDDQLNLLLHVDAGTFVDAIDSHGSLSVEDLRKLSEFLSIDEVTLVDSGGRITASTAPEAKVGDQFFTDERRQRPYRNLLLGIRTTACERFRPSTTDPNRLMKYFGMALPNGGFLQVGYVWATFEREFPRFFLKIFEHRRIAKTGYCVVLDPSGHVEIDVPDHPEARGRTAAEIGLTAKKLAKPAGQVFRALLFGERCRCLFYDDTIAGRRILAAVPLSEGQAPALWLSGGIAFVLFASLLVFTLVLRKFRMQQARIDALRAKDEAHRAADLALARDIQLAELRTDGTEGAGYRIRARMDAAREVGGDFYDYYELPDGRLVVTIADVSGKGVPAAFFMMKSRVTLKSSLYSCDTLPEAVSRANVQLAGKNPAEMFVTAWVGVFDRRTGELEYVSAGHNPPLVRRADGTVVWIQAPRCAALGVFDSARYRSERLTLGVGDRLFLYTDGVTEAMNTAGELFGNDRLEAVYGAGDGDLQASSLLPVVKRAVFAFAAGAEQSDDITMLELQIR